MTTTSMIKNQTGQRVLEKIIVALEEKYEEQIILFSR